MKLPPTFSKDDKRLIHAVIETPKGSRNKFAFDEDSWLFELRKILPSGTAFPLDFGFIPGTRGEDGDPLDCLVVTEQATYPGCYLACRPIGVIMGEQTSAKDSEKKRNDRIIAVPKASKEYERIAEIGDLGEEHLKDLVHFFIYYNEMAGGTYTFLKTAGAAAAIREIRQGIK